jgi:hypothetical protein
MISSVGNSTNKMAIVREFLGIVRCSLATHCVEGLHSHTSPSGNDVMGTLQAWVPGDLRVTLQRDHNADYPQSLNHSGRET